MLIVTVLIISAIAVGLAAFLKWAVMPVTIAFKAGREVEQIVARRRARNTP